MGIGYFFESFGSMWYFNYLRSVCTKFVLVLIWLPIFGILHNNAITIIGGKQLNKFYSGFGVEHKQKYKNIIPFHFDFFFVMISSLFNCYIHLISPNIWTFLSPHPLNMKWILVVYNYLSIYHSVCFEIGCVFHKIVQA